MQAIVCVQQCVGPQGFLQPPYPACCWEAAFTRMRRQTRSLFVTRGYTVTSVRDAALHKDWFTWLLGTCVQHMVRPEQSESHRLERPTETWLQTTTTHTHHSHTHTWTHVLCFYRGVEVSHYYFSSQVVLSVCVIGIWWWGISGVVPACESVLKHPETSESWLQLITDMKHSSWNCLDAIQRQAHPLLHTSDPLVFTGTETSSLLAPQPSFLWLHDSWQGWIYTSERLQDDWELVGADMSWPRHRLLRLLFSAVGFPPLLWYCWNPKDAYSQMSQRQGERRRERKRQLATTHRVCNMLSKS